METLDTKTIGVSLSVVLLILYTEIKTVRQSQRQLELRLIELIDVVERVYERGKNASRQQN